MSKVLLVDTNFSSAPIYQELITMGHEVHVAGGNPQDYLAKSSTNYWPINYADIQSLQSLVDKEKYDFVVPGCNDRSYESCTLLDGDVCKGVDPYDISQTLNNKGLFKRWAQQAGFPVAQLQDPKQTGLRWPLIVKPVDAYSGKGVTILKCPDEKGLASAIDLAKEASRSKDYLIEDFVEGQLYSHSAFLQAHRVQRDFVVREDGSVNPFVVDTSCVAWDFSFTVLSRIRECIEAISSQLGLVDGLIHTQFILKDDQFWLIELTRRCPGDLYSQLIELSSGFAYARNYAESFLNQKHSISTSKQTRQNILRHTVTVGTSCTFDHLHFEEPVWMERWVSLSLAGDSLKPSPASRVGIMFCKSSDDKELARLYDLALTRKLYDVIP